mgnify:CR=1 FL=1
MFTKYFFKLAILLASLFVFHFPLPSNAFEVNKIIDDFTDNPEKRWQFYTDQVMGGVSEGGASVRLDSEEPYVSEQSKDAKGILLKVRGNGENYYIHVNTNETIFLPQQYRFYYQASFPTSKNWSEVKIPFSTFKRSSTRISKYFNGKNLKTIGLLAYGRNHNALLEIKLLSFY